MCAEPNAYSLRWLKVFHAGIDEARTTQETTFICGCAPLPEFRKVIDVCCGMGRHARALSNHGYSVTGVDLDADAIAEACELGGSPNYVVADRLLVHLDYPDGSPRTIRMAVGYADANERSGAVNRLGPFAFLHGLRYHEPRLSRQAPDPIRSRAL